MEKIKKIINHFLCSDIFLRRTYIFDWTFYGNSYRLKAVKYFRKKTLNSIVTSIIFFIFT